MFQNLLATKLHPPTPSPRWVKRPHLVQRLNEGLAAGRQITLVSAPAGFGKTTCASEWLSGLDQPVTWLALDVADDEPGRFFTYLLAALQKIDPNVGQAIEGLLRAGQLPPGEIISATLVNDLLAYPGRFLLVLDDVHLIQERFILGVLEQLVANLPPALYLVLLTREDPALPLARLRANNLMTEIRAAELRFSPAEAAHFLNEGMGLGLSQADITALDERTEGWIVGLQLAGLSMRDRTDPSHFIATLSGSHRFILTYLTEEVLSRQPEPVQQFLLQTSILDRLNGDLCDAVTQRNDSHALLEQLWNANLFLVPLDDEGHWYRYHHLFAGLLSDRLKTLYKEQTAELRKRASRWYARASAESLRLDEQAAFATEAVQQALGAADYETAVSIMESHALGMIVQWYARTVNDWVQALPSEWRAKSPKTSLAFAWNYLLHGEFSQANPYLEQLTAIFSDSRMEEDPALQAEWLALQAWLLNNQGQPSAGLALANRALEMVPETDGYAHSLIYMALTGAYNQLDDYARTVEAYQKMIAYGRSAGNIVAELLGIAGLGQIALFHGQYRFTFEIASQGVERMERSGSLHPISTAVYGEIAEIFYQWNQLEQARRYIRRAVEVSTLSGFSHAAVYYNVILSRLFQREGFFEAAAQEIEKASTLLQMDGPTSLREEVVSQQVRLALANGRLADAETAFLGLRAGSDVDYLSALTQDGLSPDQSFSYPAGRLGNIALRLHVYRARSRRDRVDLSRGIDLANSLFGRVFASGFLLTALETLLLRAQLQAVVGNLEASLADTLSALELGEPEGIISVFVEEGQPVADALQLLLEHRPRQPAQAAYVRTILAAFPGARPPAEPGSGPEPLVEPLTERELNVLRLMAGGLKYEEIAGQLFISVNTVRTYVKAIYGKLAVNSRFQAVERARQVKLI